MTNLTHCDGPDCIEIQEPNVSRLCTVDWIRIETSFGERHFHQSACLTGWAAAGATS